MVEETWVPASVTEFAHPYCSTELAGCLTAYCATKSKADREATMAFYRRDHAGHYDAVLGWSCPTWDDIDKLYAQYMPSWGGGRVYATQLFGDARSGVACITETPELFGSEIRAISAVDFQDGEIIRFVDYWDGRAFGKEAADEMRVSEADFPADFGEDAVPPTASPARDSVVAHLVGALAGQGFDSAALFSNDATVEDLTLRTCVRGEAAITRYLQRSARHTPYGLGAQVSHVLGDEIGGGFEWRNPTADVPRGIVAFGADRQTGLLASVKVVWDGSLISAPTLSAWQHLVLDVEPFEPAAASLSDNGALAATDRAALEPSV